MTSGRLEIEDVLVREPKGKTIQFRRFKPKEGD